MKNVRIFLIFLSLLLPVASNAISIHSLDSTLIKLKLKRLEIDKYVLKHQKEIIILAKVIGKKRFVIVKNENWPDNTEFTYNILKDASGYIIMIAKMPYSESGDWYIEYKNYFDENGNTFAFSKRQTIFDESVKGGVAMEELFQYYNSSFKLVAKTEALRDKDEKLIKRNNKDFDFREYNYTIYKNVKECLAGYNIQLH